MGRPTPSVPSASSASLIPCIHTALHFFTTIHCTLYVSVSFIIIMHTFSSRDVFVCTILTGTHRGCRTAMTRARTSGENSHFVFILLLTLLLLPLLLFLLLLHLLLLLTFLPSPSPYILHLLILRNNLIHLILSLNM